MHKGEKLDLKDDSGRIALPLVRPAIKGYNKTMISKNETVQPMSCQPKKIKLCRQELTIPESERENNVCKKKQ